MTNFHYKAITSAGTVVRGVLDAPSEAAVVSQLRRDGHYPLSTRAAGEGSLFDRVTQALQFPARPSAGALRAATEELAALLTADLELDRALGILVRLADIGTLKEPFARVRARVRDGATFADALSSEPAFPPFYVAMVRAGEFGGTLGATFKRLADYLGRSLAVREAVTSALVYPVILLVSAALSIAFILLVVLPEFRPLFEEAGKNLPLPARLLMDAGDIARATWWLVLLALAGAAVWARSAIRNAANRERLDRALLRLPLFGKLVVQSETERFSRTLGTLLTNGVPLPTALALTKDVLWNRAMADAIGGAAQSLREGDSLARLLAETRLFPDVALDIIQIGEETGRLPDMLLRQADLDEQHLRQTIDRLLALLVPALTIVLGLVIAGIIAAMLAAILSVNDLALQ